MKLCLGALGIVMGTALITGCGPGLGHHGQWAKAPTDAVGSAALTSEEMPLPASRMSVARQWEDPWADEDDQNDPKLQTWGAPAKPEDRYGF